MDKLDIDAWTFWLLIVCLIIIFLPCKYDPAIRWAEFNRRWAKRIKERRNRR